MLETPVFSREIEILTEKFKIVKKFANPIYRLLLASVMP